MIAYLRGRVIATHEDAVVLDVGGVGYLVHCAARTLAGRQVKSAVFADQRLRVGFGAKEAS